MKEMNQKAADKIFNNIAYLKSFIHWDNEMSVAHGGQYHNEKTYNLLNELEKTMDNLYNTEISEDCKNTYDNLSNGSMFYYSMIDMNK